MDVKVDQTYPTFYFIQNRKNKFLPQKYNLIISKTPL